MVGRRVPRFPQTVSSSVGTVNDSLMNTAAVTSSEDDTDEDDDDGWFCLQLFTKEC